MAPRTKVETTSNAAAPSSAPKPKAEAATKAKAPKMVVDAPATPQPAPAKPAQQTRPATPKPASAPAPKPAAAPKPKVTARVSYDEPPAADAAAPHVDPGPGPAADATATPQDKAAGVRTSVADWVRRTFPHHEHAFWGGVIALVIAILTFVIGVGRMLLVCLLVFVGVAIGQVLDGDPKIIRMVRGLLNDDPDRR